MAEILISVADLHAQLESEHRPVVLDVRWVLGDPHGYEHFLARRVPGSVYVSLNDDLAAPATPADGRHPLPDPADLQAAARRWGLNNGDSVVVLDDNGGLAAARAWWLLRWAGLSDVRLLDGGLRAWTDAGHALEGLDTEPAQPAPGDVELSAGHLPVLSIDETAEFPAHGVLLDARAGERYRGETEPVDPRAGHIPGAVSAPTTENLTNTGAFKSPAELRARFAELGVNPEKSDEVAVYCGSGVTAAHQIAALAVAGIDAVLYPGSWSQWSNDPTRPVATGA
ncbi:sulfurtransferase [Actinospica durhamensis]|uniref:Sulfurtransferase n=1 Tax=Actinospica durhamensis TaxID=1508375 RepID=A0A941IUC3_9ACTN|nr:sulfurtransferase [Actinospica durhamensis]MBR7837253.1 sulfurtransferase [Actinospica durhamensis]